ncbi:MAG: hypothetical protein PVG11_10125 [Anaerolineae bacterium]
MKRTLFRLSLVAVAVALLCGMAPAVPGAGAPPAIGAHTIEADDHVLRLATAGRFAWIIQLLEWRAVEPVPGEFFWAYSDWLVRAAEYYGLDLVLRLDHPPDWAATTQDSVPVDLEAYAAFVERVAYRYRGRVSAYVIWNEPNLAAEWGNRPPDPAGYTRLLCAAAAAVRAADTDALVVSAGLAPTNEAGDRALDERRYLEQVYEAGAAGCFDVLGAHPYGFAYPPDDPPGAHDGLNVARLADLRAVMVARGDAGKPVWATELGWTTDPVAPEQAWLAVDEATQADNLVDVMHKAEREWPWLERIAVWNLSTGLTGDDERRGYSLVGDDGAPKPAYDALRALAPHPSAAATPAPDADRPVEILAPDVTIRLSDVDTFYPHWARPHCGTAPCREWTGHFYVPDPGAGSWQLRLEVMQVEEPGNRVWINGQALDPPGLPLRQRPDFASVWSALSVPVPAGVLRPGPNTITVRASPRLPVYHNEHGCFDSFQFRHVRLLKGF